MAKWWYNTFYHHSIKTTPLPSLYGYNPPQLSLGPYLQATNTGAQEMVQDIVKLLQDSQENVDFAQNRMKQYADKNMSEREFQVGDWVFLPFATFLSRFSFEKGQQIISTLICIRLLLKLDQWPIV